MTVPSPDQRSGNTPPGSRPMTLVGERRLPDTPSSPTTNPTTLSQLSSAAQTTTTQAEYVHRTAWKAGVLGALNVVLAIVAVRLTLLVSVSGAIWLSWLALAQPDPYRLGALGVYAVVVVVPLILLA